jgi:hypothetical protein
MLFICTYLRANLPRSGRRSAIPSGRSRMAGVGTRTTKYQKQTSPCRSSDGGDHRTHPRRDRIEEEAERAERAVQGYRESMVRVEMCNVVREIDIA